MSALDKAEIRELLMGERYARDHGQWERLRSSYHPDTSKTRIKIMWYDGDIDGFVAASKNLHSSAVAIIHQLIPGQIQIRGSKALVDSWCIIETRNTNPEEHLEYDMTTWLRIFSQCEKMNDTREWKMLTLEPIYMRDLIMPVPPLPMPDFGPELSSFRKSYRFTAWSVSRRGLHVRDNLPGADVPESVMEVCNRNQAWFDGL